MTRPAPLPCARPPHRHAVATCSLALPDRAGASPLSLLRLPGDIDVTANRTRRPDTRTVDEGGIALARDLITAIAASGPADDARRIERRIEARRTPCTNPGGLGPRFAR